MQNAGRELLQKTAAALKTVVKTSTKARERAAQVAIASATNAHTGHENFTTNFMHCKVNVQVHRGAYRVFLDKNSKSDWTVLWHNDRRAAWDKVVERVLTLRKTKKT